MIEPGKIVKSGGHCYGPMGGPDCAFWINDACGDEAGARRLSACALFGHTDKDASRALEVCDRVFGKDYEGRP